MIELDAEFALRSTTPQQWLWIVCHDGQTGSDPRRAHTEHAFRDS